jgi:hypothetical protein
LTTSDENLCESLIAGQPGIDAGEALIERGRCRLVKVPVVLPDLDSEIEQRGNGRDGRNQLSQRA